MRNCTPLPILKKAVLLLILLCPITVGMVYGQQNTPVYLDHSQPVETRIKDLIWRVTQNISCIHKPAFYDESIHDFRVQPGLRDVMVGSSSEDIRLRSQFRVSSN